MISIGDGELNIEAIDFKVKPRRLKVTWTTLNEDQLNGMMNLNSEEELIKFPSSIAGSLAGRVPSKKEQLKERKGKKFVDSYGKWLKEKNKNLPYNDNYEAYDLNDEAYDIKSNLLKEYMLERL